MYRNSALLSIGAALVSSLFFFGVGHASQIQKRQGVHTLTAAEMNGTANLSTKQVSITPIPCGGRSGAICRTQSPQGSGATATDGSLYTSQVPNTPIPCGGRTRVTCRTQSQPGSGATATDGSLYTSASMLVSLPVAGILLGFGAGLIALVGLGASRLRHHHGHHA